MKISITQKIVRKILILAFLIAALVFVSTGRQSSQPVEAAQCCELCGPDYDVCINNCGGSPTCEQSCRNSLSFCNHHCVFCDGGE